MYEGLLCACCMATEDLLELFGGEGTEQKDQSYAEMLRFSLNIEINAENHNSICRGCTKKLNDCVLFKNQVLKSLALLSSVEENKLSDTENAEIMYMEYLKDEFEEVNIKTEYVESDAKSSEETSNKEDKRTAARKRKSKKRVAKRENDHDYDISSSLDVKDNSKDSGTNEAEVKRSRRNVMDAMPYAIDKSEKVCRECGEEFPNHFNLKVHYKIHFGQFPCDVCNKRYMTSASLGKHKLTHKAGPFYCPLCGQEFRHLNSLKSHKQIKHKPLPFRCRHCAESFTTFSQRLAHEVAVHNKTEKNHKCPYCDMRFITSLLKIQHVKTVHEITIVSCCICGVQFKKSYLKNHMFKRHRVGAGWQCGQCPATRPNKADLRRHLTTHSRCPRYVCKLCNKGFAQRYALKYHIDAHIKKQEYRGDPDALMICKYGIRDVNMDEITRFIGKGTDINHAETQASQSSVEEYIVDFNDQVIDEGIEFGQEVLVAQEEYIS